MNNKFIFQVIFLTVFLMMVIGAIIVLKKNIMWSGEGVEEMSKAGQTYFNRQLGFAVSVPNQNWEILPTSSPDLLEQPAISDWLDSVRYVAELRLLKDDTIAVVVNLGIVELSGHLSAFALGVQTLRQFHQKLKQQEPKYHLLKEVTITTSGALKVAYFVIKFPDCRIGVFSVTPLSKYALWLIVHAPLHYYNEHIPEISRIIQTLRLLPPGG